VLYQPDARILTYDLGRTVAGTIVYDQQLQTDPDSIERRADCEDALDDGSDTGFFVIGGDDDR
jgi:hypothetical protein